MTAVDLGAPGDRCNQNKVDYFLDSGTNSEQAGLTDADTYRDNKNYVAHDGQAWAANKNWGNGDSISWHTRSCKNGIKNGIAYDIICS